MLGSIKYNLSHLLDFTGRDARQTFWYYVLFVYLLGMLVSVVAMIPGMVSMFSGMFEAVQSAAQSGADPAVVEQQLVATYMGDAMSKLMGQIMWVSAGLAVLNILLLAAALVRRLHDSDLSGWWALAPAIAQVGAVGWMLATLDELVATMTQTMTASTPNPMAAMQGSMSGAGLVGWVPIILVIIFGIRKSTDGPNRFAAEPVRF
jgi:uncharacterized membrane protein YhaH (DUF805 family)